VTVDLLLGTLVLRPYVFGFLAVFLVAGALDLGWRRTLLFGGCVSPIAWIAEMSSTRTGVPFGLYRYTGQTRGHELFLADVPLMDPLSFAFLAYASFCLARTVLRGRGVSWPGLALAAGVLMMLLDVVIDPVALRGDRWFLGRIFEYADTGVYFGVPVSNFAGWVLVGTAGVLVYGRCPGGREAGLDRGGPGSAGGPADPYGRQAWPGIALYYAVLAFNLAVTAWIGEWRLLLVGVAVHAATLVGLWMFLPRPAVRPGLEKQRA
jgi:putative membrane protein